ncbi:MAG: sensor histidine kinase [Spirochaetaceae bacterium]|jgi:two-component system sensor histidine kinase YesM|nr:sensor histidine kinase [Spirochaetaceae bacterium]
MSGREQEPLRAKPRFQSIQVTIALAFTLLLVTVIVGAILIAFRETEETVRIASRRYTQQLVHQITNNIEFYIDYMDSISTFVEANSSVRNYLEGASQTEREEAAEAVRSVLTVMTTTRNDISLIGVFSYQGGFVTQDRDNSLNPFADPSKQSWYTAAQNARGFSVVSSSHVQNIIRGQYRWVISLSREIIDEETGRSLGILLVDLNFRIIDRICSSIQLGERGYIFVVDRRGDIVYHPQQQLLYGGLKTENIHRITAETTGYFSGDDEDRDKFYSVETMRSTGWKVVGVNYRSEFVENRNAIQRSYTFWGLFFLIASMAISLFISQRISKPIKELRRSMQAVEQGNFDILVDIHSSNEIGELGKDFNIMVGEIKELLRRVTLEQEQKRKSELKALQMQINPHFLYNTLDSVIWMAEGGKQKEVIAMSSALARLFRLSISKGKEIIDVASEIEHVKNYLTIQKIRYKDRLDYRIEVEEEIRSFQIVKIILQPLVENAIYHGIKNNSVAGTVVISGRRTPTGMELAVRDDGIGMNPASLEKLRRRLLSPRDRNWRKEYGAPTAAVPSEDMQEAETEGDVPGSGVGVRNVDERIKLYFGPDYGLEFESREDEGTTVFIHLPAIKKDFDL